jgi:hypothetical protein
VPTHRDRSVTANMAPAAARPGCTITARTAWGALRYPLSVSGRSARHGEEFPGAGDAFQFVFASVREGNARP